MNFFNYLQPSIIKLNNSSKLPEHLRNRYMLNLNAIGIKYFIDNCMLMEDPQNPGRFLYMLTNSNEKIHLLELNESNVLDIPRAYIVLTKELVEDQTNFKDWVLSACADSSRYISGTDNFIPGEAFYINETLYEYLQENEQQFVNERSAQFVLPNYLDKGFALTECYEELPIDVSTYNNIKFFYYKNELLNLEYTEDELYSLYNTFFNIIADETLLSDEDRLSNTNQIYSKVVDYYKNWMTDETLQTINLLLNNVTNQTVEGVSTCGCNKNMFGQSVQLSESCYSIYEKAMTEYLTQMLSDVAFYKDWMYIKNIDGSIIVNVALIEHLIVLLQEFESLNIDLSFTKTNSLHQSCDSVNNAISKSAENHKTIQNYIKLLGWIADGCIDENTNKIKVYGSKFAELLPLLSF